MTTRTLRRPFTTISGARLLRLALVLDRELLLLAAIVAVAAVAHGINMANFPYYENDEGTYVSQAWALLAEGRLAPYTYWYDHAPLGWIQIAIWTAITGGFDTFGTSVASARVFMLAIQILSMILVFRVARSTTGSVALAALATALFGFSAYGIYYHRRVLLDNIATLWMLASLALLLGRRLTLMRIWVSAALLGVAILSKEVTLFVVPAMAYLVFTRAHRMQRWFGTIGWLAVVTSISSLYVLMAALRNELFPSGTLLGGNAPHVSLLGSAALQATRGNDGGLFQANSAFWTAAGQWVAQEPLLVLAGTGGAILVVAFIKQRRTAGVIGLMTLSLWAFMARGGIVLPFYLIPLLPLLALNVASTVGLVAEGTAWLARFVSSRLELRPASAILLSLLIPAGLLGGYRGTGLGLNQDPLLLWRGQEAVAQQEAIGWVDANLPYTATMVIDNYLWTDLHERRSGGPSHDLAHHYWKAALDPEIRTGVFEDTWETVDYMVITEQVNHDVASGSLPFVASVLDHSTEIKKFQTGGWPVMIRRVDKVQRLSVTEDPMLATLWAEWRARFIQDGRVMLDPGGSGTSAELQANAMLQAVYVNDRTTFDAVWSQTQASLLGAGGLLASDTHATDPSTSGNLARIDVGATQDAALALLFAAHVWGDDRLAGQAQSMLGGIWERVNRTPAGLVVVSDEPADHGSPALIRPSDWAPYAYRIFADADPLHDWAGVVDGTYATLARIQAASNLGGKAGTLPDVVALDLKSGDVSRATPLVAGADASSYAASQVSWRLALDWLWFREDRAHQRLAAITLPATQLESSRKLVDRYRLDGTPDTGSESVAAYATALGTLLVGGHAELANATYAQHVLAPTLDSTLLSKLDARQVSWAWFAGALLDGGMANLAAGTQVLDWGDGF